MELLHIVLITNFITHKLICMGRKGRKKQGNTNLFNSVKWSKMSIKKLFLLCCFTPRSYPELKSVGSYLPKSTKVKKKYIKKIKKEMFTYQVA